MQRCDSRSVVAHRGRGRTGQPLGKCKITWSDLSTDDRESVLHTRTLAVRTAVTNVTDGFAPSEDDHRHDIPEGSNGAE